MKPELISIERTLKKLDRSLVQCRQKGENTNQITDKGGEMTTDTSKIQSTYEPTL